MADEPVSLLARLKRHHIFRVASVYAIAAWVLMQLANSIFPSLGWPRESVLILIVALALLFPVVLIFGWMLIPPSKEDPASFSSWQHLRWRLGSVLTLVIVVLVVLSAVYLWHAHTLHLKAEKAVATGAPAVTLAAVASTSIPAKSIAVLPFENLSPDKNNEYFVAGMQELILTKLADIGDLRVISRTSTAQYASHPGNLKQIGEQLGVASILEGSVQKAGDQVLINVQLIDAQTDNHIWAQSYQRTLDNVFGVEGEVAQKVADELNAKLSIAESATLASLPTQNHLAYDLFLRAEYLANKGFSNYDTASWKAAIPLYRQAMKQDPKFALAWARLSHTESILASFGGGGENVQQLNRQARADAKRALKLAPDLPAAQLALGYCDYYGNSDYAGALKAFAAILAVRPNDADALVAQGYVLRRQGRFDAALRSLHQATIYDPRNANLAAELGSTYMRLSRYADAEDAFQLALALDPENRDARASYSSAILASTGDIPRALAAAQGDDLTMKFQRMSLLTYQRKYREALALVDSIPDTPDNFDPTLTKGLVQAELYQLMGDLLRARPLYAQSLPHLRAQLKVQRGYNRAYVWQNIAEVEIALGQTPRGLDAIAKSQSILGNVKDQMYGPVVMLRNAQLYAQANRPELAVAVLASTLASPGFGGDSPVMLWLDPAWDPIRHDPRFQALLQKYAQYKPAVIPAIPVSTAAPHTAINPS